MNSIEINDIIEKTLKENFNNLYQFGIDPIEISLKEIYRIEWGWKYCINEIKVNKIENMRTKKIIEFNLYDEIEQFKKIIISKSYDIDDTFKMFDDNDELIFEGYENDLNFFGMLASAFFRVLDKFEDFYEHIDFIVDDFISYIWNEYQENNFNNIILFNYTFNENVLKEYLYYITDFYQFEIKE